MISFISHQFSRSTHALWGILYAIRHDSSYRGQIIGGIFVLGIFSFFFAPFSQTEILFLSLGWVLILITELQNSSFEEALDTVHPELHEQIGRSKDMASGAVLTSGIFMAFVMIVVAVW